MVAVDGVVEPVPACTTLASDGAVVSTGDAVASRDREDLARS